MPNILHSLVVDEISLVDHPCCAEIDPKTGRKIKRAVVSFFKRDDTGDELSTFKSTNKESPYMEFEQLLKSAKTRDEVVAAVRQKAAERVAKRGGNESLSEAESRVWQKFPFAISKYESLPKQAAKREEPLIRITHAEAELDSRARRVVKRDKVSYPQACSQVLTEDPSLYAKYCEEMSRGEVYPVPDAIGKSNGGDDEDDAECPTCHGTGKVGGGRVCPACDGSGEAELGDEEAKKALLRKLDEIDNLERRILKVEADVKVRR
jgi:hypothetical protein